MTPRDDGGLMFTPAIYGGLATSPIDRTPSHIYNLGGQTPKTPIYRLADIASQSPSSASMHGRYSQGGMTPFYPRLGSSSSPNYS